MAKEIELTVYFCPGCGRERSALSTFCTECGTRVTKMKLVVCLEQGKVTRVLLKS